MIKIKELSEMIDIAQDNVYDQNVYYDKIQQTLVYQFDDELMDDYDGSDDFMLISVEPFGRDMFLDFFETLPNPDVRDMFKERFHGSKKYRKVKDMLPRYHLLEEFYAFRDQYQLKIAKAWCNENNIDYIDLDGKEVKANRERRK